jgi:hypothetical protein
MLHEYPLDDQFDSDLAINLIWLSMIRLLHVWDHLGPALTEGPQGMSHERSRHQGVLIQHYLWPVQLP